tara:strand:- start:50 stop:514 length:465 start_codon:yes stop_codon:yes gene_type:complete
MIEKNVSNFSIDWVLINEIAIGKIPYKDEHFNLLKEEGISSILSLCSEKEFTTSKNLYSDFIHERIVLPDHKSGKVPNVEEILLVLNKLKELKSFGPVFVHCIASMERSPMICMGWLIKEHNLNVQEALDYLMNIHPGTNPLREQIEILEKLNK